MPTLVAVLFALVLFLCGSAAILGAFLLWAYSEKRSFREPRTIICPENLDYTTVTVDGKFAAHTAAAGHQEFRIATCSRWPEMEGCDQECALQAPLVGDDRTFGKYAPFGMTPQQLRINNPVRMTSDMFGSVMRQKVLRYLNQRSA